MRAYDGILGTELHLDDRKYVLAAYVHRMTVKNYRANRAYFERQFARGFRCAPITDAEWLATTRFAVRRNGRLDGRVRSCYSGQYTALPTVADSVAAFEAASRKAGAR